VGLVRSGLLVCCLAAACATFAPAASAATFSNTTPITDPTQGFGGNQPDSPYPSGISVSGEAGTIVKATVTLQDVSGGPARDLDVLLVGPGGSTLLLSDICSAGGFVPDFPDQKNYTFDDDAPAPIPDTCPTAPASGTYKPTNYDTADSFPSVPSPYPIGLANVRGTTPNGLWKLFVVDDAYPDRVTIDGGWRLDLTTTGASTSSPVTSTHRKRKCRKRKRGKRSASAAKKRCKKKRR
jgi:hypothetical protein